MKKVWFDITNTPQVHFLMAIRSMLEGSEYSFEYSARDFSETVKMLKTRLNEPFITIGGHVGGRKSKKAIGLVFRFINSIVKIPEFDISISCGSECAIWLAWLRRKMSIAFGDNDTAKQWTYARFCNYAFFPNAIPEDILLRQWFTRKKLYLYDGFKEDIYLAGYKPDQEFISKLPFEEYVVVRPENVQANYLGSGTHTITPELLKALNNKGINVLYLPRYTFDREYAAGMKNVFVPDEPINGLDACYHANAVLTGAGTFAREAACLGVPSVSFFAGFRLLAVDRKMVEMGWMFHSRDVQKIVGFLGEIKKKEANLERCKNVYNEVRSAILQRIEKWIIK